MQDDFSPSTGSLKSYVFGFVASLALTLAAYYAVTRDVLEKASLINLLIVLALTQFVVQVFCFLHLGNKSGRKWNMQVFWFMIIFVLIIVFGSIWIMNNLNYNMMHMMPKDDGGF